MINIPDAVSDPLVPFDSLSAVDLCPARDAGPYFEHPELFLGIILDRPRMIGERRSGADQAHITFQDIEGLRELINGRRSDHLPDFRHPVVIAAAVDAGACMLGVHDHRTELIQCKLFVVLSKPCLFEDDRPSILKLNCQRGHQIDRPQEDDHT